MAPMKSIVVAFLLSVIATVQAVELVTMDFFSENTCQNKVGTLPFFVANKCQVLGKGPAASSMKFSCADKKFNFFIGSDNCTDTGGGGLLSGGVGVDMTQCQSLGNTGAKYNCQTFPDNNVVLMRFGTCANGGADIDFTFETSLVINTCFHAPPQFADGVTVTKNFYKISVVASGNSKTLTYTAFSDSECQTGSEVLFTAQLDGGCAELSGGVGIGRRLASSGATFTTAVQGANVGSNNAMAIGAHMYAVLAAIVGALYLVF